MIYQQFFDYVAFHVAYLGVVLVLMFCFVITCFIAYKMGRHEANKKWTRDVECMPKIIEQEIRERMEKRIVALSARCKWLQERNDAMMPAFKSLTVIAEAMLERKES